MRNGMMMLVVVLFAVGAFAQNSPNSTVSQLPDGFISKGVYLNDALGIRLKIPTGWTATVAPRDLPNLDEGDADGPVNRCSKILLSIQKSRSRKEDRVNSLQLVFVVDPICFPGAEFPDSIKDRDEIRKFADYLYNSFGGTPFISHKSGADISAGEPEGKLVIIQLTGDLIINDVWGSQPITGKPLHVNTLLCMTKSTSGYWIAWGALVDDAAKKDLMKTHIQFKVPPSGSPSK